MICTIYMVSPCIMTQCKSKTLCSCLSKKKNPKILWALLFVKLRNIRTVEKITLNFWWSNGFPLSKSVPLVMLVGDLGDINIKLCAEGNVNLLVWMFYSYMLPWDHLEFVVWLHIISCNISRVVCFPVCLLNFPSFILQLIYWCFMLLQICSISQRCIGANPLLLGFVNSHEADIGIQISKDVENFEGNFDMIFSMNFMKKLMKWINKLQFFVLPKPNSHVELIDKEWVDVTPSSPNSFELCCTIYSSLNACSSEKVCIMDITE